MFKNMSMCKVKLITVILMVLTASQLQALLYIQTQVVGLQEGVNGAGLRRTVTSSVTLWAIHAGQSDWMPDWIIRNSAGADLKRKSGKVQHWDHRVKQCRS